MVAASLAVALWLAPPASAQRPEEPPAPLIQRPASQGGGGSSSGPGLGIVIQGKVAPPPSPARRAPAWGEPIPVERVLPPPAFYMPPDPPREAPPAPAPPAAPPAPPSRPEAAYSGEPRPSPAYAPAAEEPAPPARRRGNKVRVSDDGGLETVYPDGEAPVLSESDVEAMVERAVRRSASKREAPVRKEVRSDVDEPAYASRRDPDAYALIIGVDAYADLPAAEFAERDAEAVRRHVLALGVPEGNVAYLVGSRASRAGIVKNLETWLPNNANEGSTVYFYYSGHGAPDPATGEAYLVPHDGDPKYLKDTGYPLKRLYARLERLPALAIVAMIDSCFSGAGGRSVLAKGTRPLVTKAPAAYRPSGRLVALSASRDDEIAGSLDEQGHGLFTYHLLKGLNGAAADARGRVTIGSLFDYLQPKVRDAARRDNRSQTPQLLSASPESGGALQLR